MLAGSGAGLMVSVGLFAACSASVPAPAPAPASAQTLAESDPYHPPPRDTVDTETYNGWKQFSLHCARCHGDDALGSTFGPNLVASLGPGGEISTREDFLEVLRNGRHEKGMPSAAKMGLDSAYFEGVYRYLAGRGTGRLKGGRPARSELP